MGARIAAHFANAGIPCYLLDMAPRELTTEEKAKVLTLEHPAVRNRIVRAGLEAAKKARPAAFFTPETAQLITIGNFEDNLGGCGEVDWIMEAVAESLEIKRALFARVEQHRKPGTIVSTNTSGLPIHLVSEGRSADFETHFAGTHFFNPPRYMKLVELVPGPKARPDVIGSLSEFCDKRLGKGVVVAKDTPNFIANRIGTYSMLNVLRLMTQLGMTIEEVDACTGPAVGWPKSATFRTADIVGLDVLMHVVKNIYETAPNDESRETYNIPEFLEEMARRKWLGDKTGQGFYKRVKGGQGESEILTLDLQTMEYRAKQKARFPSIEAGKAVEDTRERLRALLTPLFEGAKTDKAQQFIWAGLSEMCLYAGRRMPEISDHIEDVDRAVRWGFAWELGPFGLVDAIGLPAFAVQIKKEGRTLPPIFEKALAIGRSSFYEAEKGTTSVFDFASGVTKKVEEPAGILLLKNLKEAGR